MRKPPHDVADSTLVEPVPDVKSLSLLPLLTIDEKEPNQRQRLDQIARAGIAAVRPDGAISSALAGSDQFWDRCRESGFLLLAFGKASVEMAASIIDHLGAPIDGLVVTHQNDPATIPNCEVITASHPIPDHNSIRAGAAIRSLIAANPPNIPAVVLISGGASSLIEIPRPGVDLDDLRLVNDGLLRSGLPIASMNVIRQALSDFKGGGLAAMLGDRSSRTLVISDVVGNDTTTIASGPMSPPAWTVGDPWDISPESLRSTLPSGLAHLLQTARPIAGPESPVAVIADAGVAADAARRAASTAGFETRVLTTQLEGDAAAQARWTLSEAGPGVSIAAGETTVVVAGSGLGGRNQHAALTWAIAVDGQPGDFTGIAIGTDGRDGPTDAAGALVDSGTAARIRSGGGDPAELFADDDSNRALQIAGDLIPAWPTGTNVGDLWIVIR